MVISSKINLQLLGFSHLDQRRKCRVTVCRSDHVDTSLSASLGRAEFSLENCKGKLCKKKGGGVEGSTKFSSANFKAEFSSAFPPFPLLEVFRAFYLSLVKL